MFKSPHWRLGMVIRACNPSQLGGGSRKINAWAKRETLSEKQTKSKKTRAVVQGAEHLP
jgi:hypothetical protein